MNTQSRTNTAFLNGLCVAVPALSLFAAHFFPWRRVLARDLHPLEAYAIGTAAIVGTANVAIALSDSERSDDHVMMLNLATGSAGVVTIAAHLIDAILSLRGEVARLKGQNRALAEHGDV